SALLVRLVFARYDHSHAFHGAKTMTRRALLITAILVGSLAIGWQHVVSQPTPPLAKLPGARPAIDAANYPSLQAAIDALPPTGGVIHLPAGTFEISKPLQIVQEDVLIQGSGTATHIKNVNETGEPAI